MTTAIQSPDAASAGGNRDRAHAKHRLRKFARAERGLPTNRKPTRWRVSGCRRSTSARRPKPRPDRSEGHSDASGLRQALAWQTAHRRGAFLRWAGHHRARCRHRQRWSDSSTSPCSGSTRGSRLLPWAATHRPAGAGESHHRREGAPEARAGASRRSRLRSAARGRLRQPLCGRCRSRQDADRRHRPVK